MVWRLPESPGIIDSDKAFACHAQCATLMKENTRSLYVRMPLVTGPRCMFKISISRMMSIRVPAAAGSGDTGRWTADRIK